MILTEAGHTIRTGSISGCRRVPDRAITVFPRRGANAKIQESANASWLSKNLAYILDITFTVSFIAMLFVIIYKQVPETNKELFYTSFGLLGGYVSQILGFHRGTSKGSEEKSKELKELNKTKQ